MSNFNEANNVGKEAIDNAMRSFSAVTKGFQQIASETTEFSKRSYEQSARLFEQLAQSKSVDRVLEVQNEYARTAYEGWVSQANKLGEIYTGIAKEVYKPFEATAQRAASFGENALKQAS